MNATVDNLRPTIIPRSDQTNAEDLLGGPRTITVTDVRIGNDEQPVIIHFQGDEGRPFKPSKTVRKILIFAWGEDGRQWIGKSMTIFNDPAVRFGGMAVGGIRISHLSDIKGEITVSLTATKGKKAMHTIQKLADGVRLADVLAAIAAATGRDSMTAAKKLAQQLTGPDDIDAALQAYAARVQGLKKPTAASQADQSTGETTPPGPTFTELYARLKVAKNADDAALILDEGRGLSDDHRAGLAEIFEALFPG